MPIRNLVLFAIFLAPLFAERYAVFLDDPPVSAKFATRESMHSTAGVSYRQQIEARQRAVRSQLAVQHLTVTGSVNTLLNAVFVATTPDRVPEIKAIAGVKGVVLLPMVHRALNAANQLIDSPGAWNALGGMSNAGTGVKIGIIDTGIDQHHPSFQDSSLPVPAGYPLCTPGDCAYTNNKVIVARSYVRQVAAGSGSNPAADSRPDDYSARDRDGHGTAVASCAAAEQTTGAVTFSGVAPKAYLGNYKIYGSPQVNDGTSGDAIISAVEDAFNDGMDVISFSSGSPAFSGPLDVGAICGNPAGVPCDAIAQTFERAAAQGVVVVAAAGNNANNGVNYPGYNTVSSPGNAPSVIGVGASTNSHAFIDSVTVSGTDVPSNLQTIQGTTGDSFLPLRPVTAPMRDAATAAGDAFACSTLPAGSLTGAIALIQRGPASNPCEFGTKLRNASDAGAVGVIFYMSTSAPLISPGGLTSVQIPAIMISLADGTALKSFIASHADHLGTIDSSGKEVANTPDQLAFFSSRGPATGDTIVKPDLVAPGTNIYMAAESIDPLGELFSRNGYAAASGTSFATPITSGAAALVRQKHPNFSVAQIKSALVNTAVQTVLTDDSGDPVHVESVGAGRLNANAAVNTIVTSVPSSVAFGFLGSGSLPKTQKLQITNTSGGALSLTVAIETGKASSGATLSIDKNSLQLGAGASDTVTVTLSGSLPTPGSYYGAITVQGIGASIRIPYQYVVGDGVAANLLPLSGDGFDGTVGEGLPEGIVAFALVDQYGAPVADAPVTWTPRAGATLLYTDSKTDANGIAIAQPVLGSQPGSYSIVAIAGGQRYTFSGSARPKPFIASNSIVNAASFDQPIAPGSYISIFGTGLSDVTDSLSQTTLPLAMDYVHLSFDAPGVSVPAGMIFVSDGQINAQVPWELAGQTSVKVKVIIDYTYSNVVTIPVSTYAPGLFANNGNAAALDASNQAITSSNPAKRGQVVELFANGLGPVTNQPADGQPAPSSPLSATTSNPTVTIGGQNAPVSFSGLAPGFAGLYQVNVTVPSGLAPGTYPVVVSIGRKSSKPANLLVQ